MDVYGKDFADLYNDCWKTFTGRVWPFVWKTVEDLVPGAESWLDLCCGCGWLLKSICRTGCDAVGLDLSPHQLRHAKKNAPDATLVRADVRSFSLGRTFDVVTCMFDSLNYLMRKGDLLRAFRRARRHTAEGGCFIFDMNTFEGLADTWRHTTARHEARRTTIIESSFDARRAVGRACITWFLKAGRTWRKFEETHLERGYRRAEIEDLLDLAGFAFRSYDGHRFGRPRKRSPRLLYVCRRRIENLNNTKKRWAGMNADEH